MSTSPLGVFFLVVVHVEKEGTLKVNLPSSAIDETSLGLLFQQPSISALLQAFLPHHAEGPALLPQGYREMFCSGRHISCWAVGHIWIIQSGRG